MMCTAQKQTSSGGGVLRWIDERNDKEGMRGKNMESGKKGEFTQKKG